MGQDRIERIELYHVHVPVPTPLFPTWIPGHPITRFAATLLVVRTHHGLTGFSSGPALDRERSGLGEFIGPFLLGLDPFDVDAARERIRQASYLGWRNNWIDLAFWDLAGKARGVPVHQLLAERLEAPPSVAPPARIRSYAAFQELRPNPVRAEAVERALRCGFRGLQIGVHHETEQEDVAHLEATREAAGPETELSVHAHQAWSVSLVRSVPHWTFERAVRFVERAAELDYRWVQEPLHEEDYEGLEELRSKARIPMAGGDLSISAATLRSLARFGCYDILTPACGFAGLGRVQSAMQAALRFGLGFSPTSYGDGIELAAHIHALAAWARLRADEPVRLAFPWEPPAQMPEYRDAILKAPFHLDAEGCVAVPTGPGLGVELDPAALKRYAKRFYELTPIRLMVSTARRSGLRQTAAIALRPRGGAHRKSRT